MNLNSFSFNIELRSKLGSHAANQLRKQEKVPTNFYSAKKKLNINGFINEKELEKAIKSKMLFNQFTKVLIDGKEHLVIARKIQRNSLTEQLLHIDFQIVEENEKIKVLIPVKFINKEICEPIKLGGVLNVIYEYIPLIGLVKDMPNYVEYDLKNSISKQSLLLKDLKFSNKVEIAKEFSFSVIASILAARKKAAEEVKEEAEAA